MFLEKLYSLLDDDFELPHGLDLFDIGDPTENLYYSCGYEVICIHCGDYFANADEDAEIYPEYVNCDQPEVQKLF